MSNYVLSSEVRLLVGLTQSDISNDDLDDLIELATQFCIRDLTISVRDECPTGSINGVNKTFEVAHYPIADISGNKTVGAEDITVYTWGDKENPATKSSISVSTVYDRDGIIVVTTAPSGTFEALSIDYSYTLEENIDWELVKMAVAYLTGYIFAIKKFTVVPDSLSRGPIRFRYYTKPYNEYLSKYYELMNQVKSKRHIKKSTVDMTLDRKRLS